LFSFFSLLTPLATIRIASISKPESVSSRIANGVNKLKNENKAIVIITHYQRLLNHIIPDYVHVMYNGKIVKSGTKELAYELEEKGYDWIKQEVNV